MKWSDIEKDKLGTRFYGEFNESSDNIEDLIDSVLGESSNYSLSKEVDTFNIHMPVEAGLIYFYPCNSGSLDEEVSVQFCVQFKNLMDNYDSACNGDLSDSAFDFEINKILKNYVSQIDEVIPKDKMLLQIVYIDEARTGLFEYIEIFYNRKRRHSANDNLSPVEFEESYVLAA